jgi:hypothetical protein
MGVTRLRVREAVVGELYEGHVAGRGECGEFDRDNSLGAFGDPGKFDQTAWVKTEERA